MRGAERATDRPGVTEELRQDIQRRVLAVQGHYHRGGRTLRAMWVVAAFVVIVTGAAMMVLPGPAIIVIPIGLAMLAARFRWAQLALHPVIHHGVRLQRRIAKAGIIVRLASGALTAVMLALLVALVLR